MVLNNNKLQIILAVLGVVLLGLQYRLWIGAGSWEEIVSLQKEISHQKMTNDRLLNRNHVLENEVYNLKNGLDSVEERARSELGLIREGETLFILADKNH